MRCQVVERWCTFSNRRIDLFGFIDIVALDKTRILGIQCTTGGDLATRVAKVQNDRRDQAIDWMRARGEIWLVGWYKYKEKVDGKWWRPRILEMTRELEVIKVEP
jgi:hypothetical protein